MVLFVVAQLPHTFKDADVLWLLDNTVSLHAHVKGMSGNTFLRRLVACTHMCWFRAHANVWYEFVGSEDNWADGISRRGFSDITVANLAGRFQPTYLHLKQSMHWWSANIADLWEEANV